ncbi:class I SAM-dependent methyltransferase [Streptomyces sp. NPDC097619]|uniref:class I SAM-dependent methyltransferase n=1 Tax=Streptomyces sp. NPDC097619 TaxID=3157228 RepID=UPI0033317283
MTEERPADPADPADRADGTGSPSEVPRAAPGTSGHYGEDLFEPAHPREAERIDDAAVVYDPVTTGRLRALGAGPGQRCLEIGAGTGTVARWLLTEGGAAEVVAVDRDTSALAGLAASLDPGPAPPSGAAARLRVALADVTDPASLDSALGSDRFDLVHARFVLMHLPERRRVLAGLAARLAPGGLLLLGDAVDPAAGAASGGSTPSDPNPAPDSDPAAPSAYRRTMDAMWRALRATIGTDIGPVTRYPRFLHEEGLVGVGAELYCPPLVPGGPLAEFWRATWQRMRPALEERGGVDPTTVDEALAVLAAPATPSSPGPAELGPGMLLAWGRRP